MSMKKDTWVCSSSSCSSVVVVVVVVFVVVVVVVVFTAPCYSNGAVLPSYDVCLSVRLSFVIPDHIRWATWNFITLLISPMSSLAVCRISAI